MRSFHPKKIKEAKKIASGKIKTFGSFKCSKCNRIIINPKKELECPYCEND